MLVLEICAKLVCLDAGQALKEGLICALNKEYSKFLFLVNAYWDYVLPLRICTIIRDIHYLVNSFEEISFNHVYKEVNFIVDS